MKQVKILIVGCGARGSGYGRFVLQCPERAKVVAIAEPIPERRNAVGDAHNVPPEYRFNSWEDVARLPRLADAVLICTQDQMHEAPAIAFAQLGYDILLEKPMAPTAESCRRIVAAVKKAGVLFAVCHVLRYTAYTRKLKEVLASGAIGEIINIQHLEPVGYWHQAHSFVRGNWRNEEESSFMLLAKCCHDVDWLR
ncbi:MAG: Gfo/Idh/MocA family oxidoreductase, partial [Victivallales bacterium]|nr:Gfo/Idh/MocA family oxidoreductase [Victivallales bacterium]